MRQGDGRPPGLDILAPGYGPLFDRVRDVLAADERVRALWLYGSLAKGNADAASDLDFILAVRDDDCDTFGADWRRWLAAITPTVLARPLRTELTSFYSVTSGGEHLDMVVEAISRIPTTTYPIRRLVFDRDGLDALVPAPDDPPPDPWWMAGLIQDLIRDHMMLLAVVARSDWLLGVFIVQEMHGLLYRLCVMANGPSRFGNKQRSAKLTAEQRRQLEAMPVPQADRESVLAAHAAAMATFDRLARPLAERHAVNWPWELERVAAVKVARTLGVLPPPPTWHVDPATLREVMDRPRVFEISIAALRARLEGPVLPAAEELRLRARLGGEARVAGHLDLALDVLRDAVALADRCGEPRDRVLARLRLAHVHQWREEWALGDPLFADCVAAAEALDARDRSFVAQHAGEIHFAQGRWAEAEAQFERALALRRELGDEALAESSRTALEAARGRLSLPPGGGGGPATDRRGVARGSEPSVPATPPPAAGAATSPARREGP